MKNIKKLSLIILFSVSITSCVALDKIVQIYGDTNIIAQQTNIEF